MTEVLTETEFITKFRKLNPENQTRIRRLLDACNKPGFTEEYKRRMGADRDALSVEELDKLLDEWEARA